MIPKYAKPLTGTQATGVTGKPGTLHPLAQAIQSSPHLLAQRKLLESVNASHGQGKPGADGKPGPAAGMNAEHKEMLILNSLMALEEEKRKKKRF